MQGLIAKPGLFRLALALAVVTSHLSVLEIGRVAVLMFFYLSGFWVTRLWETRYSPNRLMTFYGSRWFRIWPLYFLSAAIAVVVSGKALRLVDVTLLGLGTSGGDPLGVAWSLDIELQFYLLLPALAWLLAKNWKAATTLLVATACIAGWAAYLSYGVMTVAQYLPPFILGMVTYLARWQPSRRTAHLSLAAFLVFTVGAALFPFTSMFFVKDEPDPFHKDLFGFLWMLPALPYIAHSLTLPSGKFDRRLGDLSYPLYLIHMPIIVAMQGAFGDAPSIKVVTITIALAAAVGAYFLADRPLDALRQRIFEPRRAPAPQAP